MCFIKVLALKNKHFFYIFSTFGLFHQKSGFIGQKLNQFLSTGWTFLILLFFLQFAEFNLKAPPYSKTLHYSRISVSRAPLPFRSFYNQDCKKSSCGNVALKNSKVKFFFFLLRQLLLKAQFNLVPADILKNHGVHPVLL